MAALAEDIYYELYPCTPGESIVVGAVRLAALRVSGGFRNHSGEAEAVVSLHQPGPHRNPAHGQKNQR